MPKKLITQMCKFNQITMKFRHMNPLWISSTTLKSEARRTIAFLLLTLVLSGLSCKKYLEKKPLLGLIEPTRLEDLQALLDNNLTMNYLTTPSLAELCSDNYYVIPTDWEAYDKTGNYNWMKGATEESSWQDPYTKPVYVSNVVLDMLPKINYSNENQRKFNSIKGAALFFRSFAFFQLAQVFCSPYSNAARNDMGIVLRLTSAIESPSVRSSVEETYRQIIDDLKLSSELLPEKGAYFFQPSKCAALGVLARVYLSMQDYSNASKYANLALALNDSLLDYNSIIPATATNPFLRRENPEIIFYNTASIHALLDQTVGIIDSLLYNSYEPNDLRKTVFFRFRNQKWRFKGSYGGYSGSSSSSVFDGIATDELYLIRAECLARAGSYGEAMYDLNKLLRARWVTGTFTDLIANNPTEALQHILFERRKELIYRGIRWSDLRRFNLEGYNITLTRELNGQIYTLPPNDNRWVCLIPWEEINRSNIPQNVR